MIKTVPWILLMLCGCLIPVLVGANPPVTLPDPGPENGGLCLRLIITPERDVGSHMIAVELQNTGPKVVTLIGEWDCEEDRGDYEAFFAKRVAFSTCPEVQPESFQTAGRERHAQQPRYKLAPGKSLVVSWKAQGDQIREDSPFPGTTPVFPGPGLYGVRASIVVVTKEGGRVLLISNEQTMAVGGVRSLPKYATAHVVSTAKDKNLVTLDVGSDKKIAKGDTFVIRWGLQASWRVTVVKVYPWGSDGSVVRLHHDGRPRTPQFPPEQWPAMLEPKHGTVRDE